ncbi:M protein [Ekpoma virus 1]|uniref:Matrix protein n=1 Tax=Ekpoma virus 1 TaxID=1987020 RepID=A0A0C5BZP1_9RHAB|nr:M protein [Ekpoma virus 1]AJN08912.1 M protein [Ekpoma virus 1]
MLARIKKKASGLRSSSSSKSSDPEDFKVSAYAPSWDRVDYHTVYDFGEKDYEEAVPEYKPNSETLTCHVQSNLEIITRVPVRSIMEMLRVAEAFVDEFHGTLMTKVIITPVYESLATHLTKDPTTRDCINLHKYKSALDEIIVFPVSGEIKVPSVGISFSTNIQTTFKGHPCTIRFKLSAKPTKRNGQSIFEIYNTPLPSGHEIPALKDVLSKYEIGLKEDGEGSLFLHI